MSVRASDIPCRFAVCQSVRAGCSIRAPLRLPGPNSATPFHTTTETQCGLQPLGVFAGGSWLRE